MAPPPPPSVVEEMVYLPALPLLALGPLRPLVSAVAAVALRSLGGGRCTEGGSDLRCAGGRDRESSLASFAPSAIAIVRVEVSENNHSAGRDWERRCNDSVIATAVGVATRLLRCRPTAAGDGGEGL